MKSSPGANGTEPNHVVGFSHYPERLYCLSGPFYEEEDCSGEVIVPEGPASH